jgi:uncharacterized protein (UPF0333 family)
MKRYRNKGQSLLEYSILIVCIVAALYAMQHYMKRAIQGRVKRAGDEIGEPYDSAVQNSTLTTTINGTVTVDTDMETLYTDVDGYPVGGFRSNVTQNETVNRTGYEKILPWE